MIYLDNAATTVCKFPASVYDDIWSNANAPYKFGRKARELADDCREKVKECLGVKGGKVIFCSNASEAAKILLDKIYAENFCLAHWFLVVIYFLLSTYVGSYLYLLGKRKEN